MSASLKAMARERLAAIDAAGRRRRRRVITGGHGVALAADDAACINFCNNDYLGLATDPRLADALATAAGRVGT